MNPAQTMINTTKTHWTLHATASQHRVNEGLTGGVVITHNGKTCGWMNTLRNPEKWQPGCIAIDADGNLFKAVGGDNYNGAEEWVVM